MHRQIAIGGQDLTEFIPHRVGDQPFASTDLDQRHSPTGRGATRTGVTPLRRRGRYGLLYIDGDADFYQPEVNPLRGAASASDLAFATGRGPDVVTDIEGRRPLVRDDDVVVFACRDAADRERRGCQPLPENLLVIDRDQVRRPGAGAAASEAVRYLTREGGPEDGFWIHLDADVFDETIMQAVDDPRPDGLAWDEVVSALSVALRSGRATGLQVAIYNPDIDTDGSNGRGLAATVREALSASAGALTSRPRGRVFGI
jgi:arginase